MIETYSQRLSPPYSGQVQIAETDTARALTLDGKHWEIQFRRGSRNTHERNRQPDGKPIPHSYIRVANIESSETGRLCLPPTLDVENMDERILKLVEHLAEHSLPFPASDHYECWLLDAKDESPLALLYSCNSEDDIPSFPSQPEWIALPASMMKIELTDKEQHADTPPVNYRLERRIAERAGLKPRATWVNRRNLTDPEAYPPCLVTERWTEEQDADLCQRYIARQAPRLLMLHDLKKDDRVRLELAAKNHALEVERFHPLYPKVIDSELMSAIRVEAQLRKALDNTPS